MYEPQLHKPSLDGQYLRRAQWEVEDAVGWVLTGLLWVLLLIVALFDSVFGGDSWDT